MAWKPSETRIEEYRRRLGTGPTAVLEEICASLKRERWTRVERARLLGLQVAACTSLGEFDAAERAYHQALEKPVTAAATAEIHAQYARLCGTIGTPERLNEAHDVATQALVIAKRLPLEVKPGQHPATKRRRRWNRFTLAGCHVVAGDIARYRGDLDAAFDRARSALQIADPRSVVWLAAISLLTVVCLDGPPTVAQWSLSLVRQARESIRDQRGLTLQKLKLRWVEAIAFARYGSLAWAERVLSCDVIPKLEKMGRRPDLVEAIEHYLWAVARSSKLRSDYHRAELERRYGPLGTDT